MPADPSGLAVVAVGATPAFFSEVALLMVASALVAYLCHRLRVTPIVSFLVAGAAIGPQALGLVRDKELIEAAAEVGVILLLFTIGIEFSLERLGRIKRLIFVGGGLQVGLTVLTVAALLRFLNVGWRAAVFTGFLVALSSTAIVMKLLMDRRQTRSDGGQASLGILIFQDLAVVAMVLLVPMLGGEGGTVGGLAGALAKAVGIVLLVLLVARRVMPRVLEAVARTCSQEIFLLTVVAICFGTAWLTSLAGVSLSLGAFLAGLVISESRFSEMAIGEILPLQILFSAIFFVSVGLLLDLRFLVARPLLVAGAVVGALLIKLLATGVSVKVLGYGTGTSLATGLMLAQIGEFSFVLERAGNAAGLFPAGLEDGGPQTFIAATVVLMMATPLLSGLGMRLQDRLAARPEAGENAGDPGKGGGAPSWRRDHVLIAGFGEAARRLAPVLEASSIPYLILTLSPGGARDAEAAGLPVLRGNYTRRHELTHGGIREARLLVVADDDPETAQRVVGAARALNPDLRVLARARAATEAPALRTAGASEVVTEDQESIVRLASRVLEAYEVEPGTILRHQESLRSTASGADAGPSAAAAIRLSARQRTSSRCGHAATAGPATPATADCEECLEIGDDWVHLRVCMSCGHVGCCDASKNRHATAHHHATGHPIVKSLEPGEDWAWCYADETML